MENSLTGMNGMAWQLPAVSTSYQINSSSQAILD